MITYLGFANATVTFRVDGKGCILAFFGVEVRDVGMWKCVEAFGVRLLDKDKFKSNDCMNYTKTQCTSTSSCTPLGYHFSTSAFLCREVYNNTLAI